MEENKFSVEADENKTVDGLKKKINKKNLNVFTDVDADMLQLFRAKTDEAWLTGEYVKGDITDMLQGARLQHVGLSD
ncbi:unnamed protein product [Phytophthora lilii]|uniref:Unnamed protein product n=1 Tax=Phytophthora lilii TaxID=2077276 RepID=A0A9W6TAG8_9STRA|nr:unnamed protein product [Phytophthora lilii]